MQTVHDPSLSSYYVTDALYQELVDAFADWQRDEHAVGDAGERDFFRALIEREALRDLLTSAWRFVTASAPKRRPSRGRRRTIQ